MPFSILLLAAGSSERHITGAFGQKVIIDGSRLQPGELVLCFDKLDTTDLIRQGLGMLQEQKCCDGIIYYARGTLKIICLVEMKGSKLNNAAAQLKATYDHLQQILKTDCQNCKHLLNQITWRAYVYRSRAAMQDIQKCQEILINYFGKENVAVSSNLDITGFLRGESVTQKGKNPQKNKQR